MNTRYPLLTLTALVAAAPGDAAEFFTPTQIHDLTLVLTQTDWDAMTPSRGNNSGPMSLEFPEIKASLVIDGKSYVIGLRFKGNSSYMMSSRGTKRPFKVDLNQYVKGQSHEGQTKLSLNNNASDQTQIRETLAYELFRRLGVPCSRTTFAKVTVQIEGKDNVIGLYTIPEQVDSAFLKNRFGTSEGLLLKPEGARGGLPYLGEDWKRYEQLYEPKGKPTADEKARFIAFTKLINGADDATFQKEIGTYLDIDAFAKFLAGNVVTSNGDSILSMGHNFYIWHNPKSGKYQFLPWDLNMAFGGFPIGDPLRLSLKKPYAGQNRLLDRFLALPEARAAYERACREAAEHLAALGSFHDAAATAAKPIAALDPPGGGGFGPGGRGNTNLKSFLTQRSVAVLAQLDGKEVGVEPQGGGPGGGGPGGFNPAELMARGFLQLTGAGDSPTLAAFTDAWKKGAAFCDKNKDGKLTRDEFLAGVNSVLGEGPGPGQFLGPQLWSAFKASESLSTSAFTATLTQWATRWDSNQDGTLTIAELGVGLQKVLPAPDFGGGLSR